MYDVEVFFIAGKSCTMGCPLTVSPGSCSIVVTCYMNLHNKSCRSYVSCLNSGKFIIHFVVVFH